MNTRMTSKNHANLQPYAWPTRSLLQFLWALSPKKALAPEESERRQDDENGSKTAKKRLRNGWVAVTASKTTTIFEPIGVLTRYQTSALKVYWSSSLSAPRIWAPDCNISIENLEYQMIRSLYILNLEGFSVRSVGAGKLFVLDFPIQPGYIQSPYKNGDFQMPITLSKI